RFPYAVANQRVQQCWNDGFKQHYTTSVNLIPPASMAIDSKRGCFASNAGPRKGSGATTSGPSGRGKPTLRPLAAFFPDNGVYHKPVVAPWATTYDCVNP